MNIPVPSTIFPSCQNCSQNKPVMKWRERPLCFSGAPDDRFRSGSDFSSACPLTTSMLAFTAPDHSRDAPRNFPPSHLTWKFSLLPRDLLMSPPRQSLFCGTSRHPAPSSGPPPAAPPSSNTPGPFGRVTRLALDAMTNL